jgi:hypothetical protein
VVVVGADVVGVVLGAVRVDVDGTVVVVEVEVEVDGAVVGVVVVPLRLVVALAPGCSSATTKPMRAVAPAAAAIVAPVR